MRKEFEIPLSLNPVDAPALRTVLAEYDGRDPMTAVDAFERALPGLAGAPSAVALNSGTAAIHLALKLLGVTAGDRVIAPAFSYIASVSPLLYLGAEPILVDCEADTWNIDPALTEKAVDDCIRRGKKPKAIIVVHTYGMPARMQELLAIARHYGIPVMEDAAEAIGSRYNGKPLGAFGDAGVLSFNNNKILTTYGGGAVLTHSADAAARILFWATHARENLPYYEHREEGYNYRMSPMNAIAGLAGLASLDSNVQGRRRVFESYVKRLANAAAWQQEPAGSDSNRWFSCFTFKNSAGGLQERLARAGIESRPLWKPMHRQPVFATCMSFLNGNADALFASGICLPSGSRLTEEQIERVCRIVIE